VYHTPGPVEKGNQKRKREEGQFWKRPERGGAKEQKERCHGLTGTCSEIDS
jgi:hypothetical protein